jgi:teichoic acid transport system ATP-binding protein
MNNDIAIKLDNLTKIYKLYDRPIDRLKESLHWRGRKYHKDFYALNDISFEIKKGECVGIIGKNGSGKSTLLKIITGVLTQSSGSVTVNGRVSALLELGAGFNPEYTGVENIYFQGNLMGYSEEEMNEKLQAILDFADIGDFIRQPVKMYSSGMFARLAFAVAINVEPDILIVDEALAVGDMVFQAKCMMRMTQMMEGGVTVLFVSHDTHSVKTLCNKALFLSEGMLRNYGDSADVVNEYISMQHMQMNDHLKEIDIKSEDSKIPQELQNNNIPTIVSIIPKQIDMQLSQRYGDKQAEILNAIILDESFKPVIELITNHNYYVQMAIKFNADLPTFVCGVGIASLDGVQQIVCLNSQDKVVFPSMHKDQLLIVNIKFHLPLKAGTYKLNLGLELPVINNVQHQMLDVIQGYSVVKVVFENQDKQFYSMFYNPGKYYLNEYFN